jgi:hypothetical protein
LRTLRVPIYSEIFGISYPSEATPSSEGAQLRHPAIPPTHSTETSTYFNGIENFGEWLILLSERAQKDLQGVKQDDAAMFQIVMKKIE